MNDECGNEIISKKTLIYWPGLPSCILCDVLCTVYVLLIPLTRCSYFLMYFVVCLWYFVIFFLSCFFFFSFFASPSYSCLLPSFFLSLPFSPYSYSYVLLYSSSLCPPPLLLTYLFFRILLFVLLSLSLLLYSSLLFYLSFFYTCHYRYILKLTRNVFINLRLGDQPSLN